MLSQNVAKSVVPSYYMIRNNLPHRKPMNQWQPVYYFAGITKRQQHQILLSRKRQIEAEEAAFDQSKAMVAAEHAARMAIESQPTKDTPLVAVSSLVLPDLSLARRLYSHGLVHLAAPIVDRLHARDCLRPREMACLIQALAADRVRLHVFRTLAQFDPAPQFKLMGDQQATERLAEATRLFEMACARFGASSEVITECYNALMVVLLSCGFENAARVSGTLYDEMGVRGLRPTARTYELVMLSLALQGNTTEADSVLTFLRNHHADEITVNMFNAMILGHRENKTYDLCDQVWNELVDRRFPRANVASAELYLRSIVDHSYTKTTDSMSRYGRFHVGEKKKIPIVLSQLDNLGIPRIHLSPPLLDEVEDALRKFSIYKSRFYEWGRAVKQFNFIEARRRQGWLRMLDEVSSPTEQAGLQRDPQRPDAPVAPVLTAEVPSFVTERPPWMLNPLEDLLSTGDSQKERMDDVRAGNIFYDDRRPVHQRSATWLSEVPQTRYDPLYGMSNPDIPKIGIRRHLEVDYVNKEEVAKRDAQIVKKSISHARRVRQKSETFSTHRRGVEDK